MDILLQSDPIRAMQGLTALAILGLAMVAVLIMIPVLIARWIFRVNEIAAYQRQTVEQLIGLRTELRARAGMK